MASPAKLLFLFREQERIAARRLAIALRGSGQRERFSFPGFQSLFKTDIQIDSNPVVLADLSQKSFDSAVQRVSEERKINANTLPILIVPDDNEATYLAYKAVFAHEGIPTQVCTSPIIQDDNLLRWSIANIALQIFCKSGGQPWKVRPTSERSVIIGISQSHKIRQVNDKPAVEKYFAFSVMTDSSGLFQRIQVLGEGERQPAYLQELRTNLRQIISESSEIFSRVVIHTSFKLKHREIDAIYETVKDASGECDPAKCQFAVIKVNHKSRFFGVNRDVNSLVPYEATRVKLGRGEYLVWFEGIFPDRPTVSKAYPGPTHLEFMRISDENQINDEVLLQDLVNLSGANWRGFNAKSAPVSVFYCHLVADFVHDFHERGLPPPSITDLRPWFL
jgi:argonaute-like protein implicated in RNA metabolism and viral defense